MANQIIAVKTYLKETLPIDMEDRISCVNVLLMLFAFPNVFVHQLVDKLAVYGDEIEHARPLSVEDCKKLLGELERLEFVKSWVGIYRLSDSLKADCERVNREAGFEE